MLSELECLRELNILSVILRLALAMLCGGMIGMERGRKHRPAGFRTYMLVCLGAALTMLLGQYEWTIMDGLDNRVDVARFGAQVINGIGFLGAGTIIVTGKQQVKGATTAAGLWASACAGLAIGAGFYECIMLTYPLVIIIVRFLPIWEEFIVDKLRNMIIYVEFDQVESMGAILRHLRALDILIYDVEIQQETSVPGSHPSAVFTVRLSKKTTHTRVLAHISQLECISNVEEI